MRLVVPYAIRRCRPGDLAALEWEGRFAAHRPIFEEALAAQDRGAAVLLVAERGGILLGQAFADLERVSGAAHFWAVRVRPALRGLHLGETLVRALEASVDADAAQVTVDPGAAGALRFWTRLGFEGRGTITERWIQPTPDGPVQERATRRLLRRELQPRPSSAMASRYPWSVPTSTYDEPA